MEILRLLLAEKNIKGVGTVVLGTVRRKQALLLSSSKTLLEQLMEI